jgi:hypothetical protein
LLLNNNFFVGAISQVSELGVQFWVPPILFSLELLRAWFDLFACSIHQSMTVRASVDSGAQHVTLQKYFSHPSFSYLVVFKAHP